MKSEQEMIEELAWLMLEDDGAHRARIGVFKNYAQTVIRAGYRLPESEKKECEHEWKSRGEYQSCDKCLLIKQPTPAAEGIVWPDKKEPTLLSTVNPENRIYNHETKGWNACHDAHKEAREAYEAKIKEIGLL